MAFLFRLCEGDVKKNVVAILFSLKHKYSRVAKFLDLLTL